MKRIAPDAFTLFCLLFALPANAKNLGLNADNLLDQVGLRDQVAVLTDRLSAQSSAMPQVINVTHSDAEQRNALLSVLGASRKYKYAHVVRRTEGLPEAIRILEKLQPFTRTGLLIDQKIELYQPEGRGAVYIAIGPLLDTDASGAEETKARRDRFILTNKAAIADPAASEGADVVLDGQIVPVYQMFR